MALKADRSILDTNIQFYLNEVAERGVVVCVSTAASGVDLDGVLNLATVAAASSGQYPLGVLLNDFVDIDQSQFSRNTQKDQQVVGEKCSLVTKGWVVTDQIVDATAGAGAVLASSGAVATKDLSTHNEASTPTVGKFLTGVDENGFAILFVDL